MDYNFVVRLLVKHPTSPLNFVYEILGRKAKLCNNFGEQKATPKGRLIGGTWQSSIISFEYFDDYNDNSNLNVMSYISECIKDVEKMRKSIDKELFHSFQIEIIVDLSDRYLSAFLLSSDQIKVLAESNCSFGIEIFESRFS